MGKPVAVHYNPHKPSTSCVSEGSLNMLLQNRAPALAAESYATGDSVPEWITPFLWAFIWIASIGLVASLWVHVGAVMGRRVAPEVFFWILHVRIFVVWFPAALTAQSVVGNLNRRDFWRVVLKGSPGWMRYMVYGFFGYACVNFLLLMTNAPTGNNGPNPPAAVWRGFSGHGWLSILRHSQSCTRQRMECMLVGAVPTVITFRGAHATVNDVASPSCEACTVQLSWPVCDE